MTKCKYDPKQLMELAIDVMRRSVHEPRSDGKVSPLVGAVLYKPDGTVETAYRGELRDGDHAEYTLLERKNRNSRLDETILFVTLEPCAPGARGPTKLSCAERIVLARIKEIWIGIEDIDPKVARKGIKYLQDAGLTVHMFVPGLQKPIHEENKKFIAQAAKRAAAEKKKPKKVALSTFEHSLSDISIGDLSVKAMEQYWKRAKIKDSVGSASFNRMLLQQGLMKKKDGKFIPTGFGFLLFGEKPRRMVHQAGLLGTIYYPNGKEERREFDEPLVLIPGLVEEWLTSKLPNIIDRSRMRRAEQPALPFELVREGVVNALIHRDYDITGGKCQLAVTEDTITIKSPGRPPTPITIEQLQSFNAPMLSRNPKLHYVFAHMEMAEEQGFGIQSLKSRAEQLGLPLPQYTFDDPYLVLTLFRSPESAIRALDPNILNSLNEDEISGWELLASKTAITMTEYAKHMEFDNRKAQRHLKQFVDLGLLRRVGSGRTTKYQVIKP